ncbi:MAG: MarR family transcriptional regulator [Streptosporangiales bacterium]|nr:MarR family transcriptional regulator [Streptosporangiales bacterium]
MIERSTIPTGDEIPPPRAREGTTVRGVAEFEWLDDQQQRDWRRYLLGSLMLTERLDRDLRQRHDLSLAEYEVLVRLSEADDRSLRMAELAEFSNQSRSRLSHTVDRLQKDGLVVRDHCDVDRRGVWARLTDTGFARLEEAAYTHVAGVREYLVETVGPTDFTALGRAFQAVVDRLSGGDPAAERCIEAGSTSPSTPVRSAAVS